MSGPCCPSSRSEYRRLFGRKLAGHEARRYRRKGLSKTARELVAAAGTGSVLDVGGGVGTIALELVERGASRATVVELSDGYEQAARELLAEHDLRDRVERSIGDIVTGADLVEPHDIVVLHRVVCCYPDADALVSAAARYARASLLLTYPRIRLVNRLGFGAINLWLWLTRCSFRTFVHPFATIAAAAEREGLELTAREPQGLFWENAAFVRLPEGCGGNSGGMEPRHCESETEQIASERAADATEESRERRGEDDIRIEDDDTRHDAEPDEEVQI